MRWIQILMAALAGGVSMFALSHALIALVSDSFTVSIIAAVGVGVVAYFNTPRPISN